MKYFSIIKIIPNFNPTPNDNKKSLEIAIVRKSRKYNGTLLNLFSVQNLNTPITVPITVPITEDDGEFNVLLLSKNDSLLESKLELLGIGKMGSQLKIPMNSNGELVQVVLKGIDSYIDERFFNFDFVFDRMFSVVQSSIDDTPIGIQTKTLLIRNSHLIYDRYSDVIIKEYGNNSSNNLIKNHLFNLRNSKSPIKISQTRKLNIDPYDGNQIVSPADGRVRGFVINPTLHIGMSDGRKQLLSSIIKDDELYNNGFNNGFSVRIASHDGKKIIVPYDSVLTNLSEGSESIVFKFETTYFMPRDVKERDYWSAITGNHNYSGSGVGMGNRYSKDYYNHQKPQQQTHLTYYIIVSSPNNSKKIKNRSPKTDFNRGDELCYLDGGGFIFVVFNRPIKFQNDIAHYSSLPVGKNKKAIECRVLRGDGIGTLL